MTLKDSCKEKTIKLLYQEKFKSHQQRPLIDSKITNLLIMIMLSLIGKNMARNYS